MFSRRILERDCHSGLTRPLLFLVADGMKTAKIGTLCSDGGT